jgi:DNA-binding GntR family transcriptional regulator
MTPLKSGAARHLLQERAYEELKGLIQRGAYPPGTFLSERLLAGRLGMSKTPIKSALTRLDMEGFVAVSPQQGIVVREPSVREILDLFDLREAIETFAVQRIAGQLSPEQSGRLKQHLRAQVRAAREKDVETATRLDAEFHTLLCEFLGNREISQALWRMREKLHRLILGNFTRIPRRMAESVKEHAGIARAVLEGKGSLAAERVRTHLDVGRRLILSR